MPLRWRMEGSRGMETSPREAAFLRELQLACSYFVFTVFTTVGFGALLASQIKSARVLRLRWPGPF